MYLQADTVDGKVVKGTKNILPCTLDDATKKLIELILSNDMFKEAMECMDLGVSQLGSLLLQTGSCIVLNLSAHKYLFCKMPV